MTKQNAVATIEMLPIEATKQWYNSFVAFSKDILKDGLDYGVIPGVSKPTLLKPGAEKLRFVYGLTTEIEKSNETLDLVNKFYDVSYKCTVKTKDGQILAQCEGNVNSAEPKYAYIWVAEDQVPENLDKTTLKKRGGVISEFQFALNKMETTGKYGKPQEYWDKWLQARKDGKLTKVERKTSTGKAMIAYEMGANEYRIPNPDVIGLKNTIMKMAQKRAFVGAMLMATGASEFFTQDVEDMEGFVIDDSKPEKKIKEVPVEEGEVIDETPKTETKSKKVTDLENNL